MRIILDFCAKGGNDSHAGWHVRRVQTAMDERDKRKQVFGVLLRHRPINPSLVSRRVPEHAEGAAQQIGKVRFAPGACLPHFSRLPARRENSCQQAVPYGKNAARRVERRAC
jgi:hypothetical protein